MIAMSMLAVMVGCHVRRWCLVAICGNVQYALCTLLRARGRIHGPVLQQCLPRQALFLHSCMSDGPCSTLLLRAALALCCCHRRSCVGALHLLSSIHWYCSCTWLPGDHARLVHSGICAKTQCVLKT
jgi:hypothetical protein